MTALPHPVPHAFLIEDSSVMRANLTIALKDFANIDVVAHAETERAATNWLRKNPDGWQLAVVDLFLREGSGLGVLAECKLLRRDDQQVVVLSNHASDDVRARAQRLGVDAVFDKATEVDDFLEYCALLGKDRQPLDS